jgi:hypothetical protein
MTQERLESVEFVPRDWHQFKPFRWEGAGRLPLGTPTYWWVPISRAKITPW